MDQMMIVGITGGLCILIGVGLLAAALYFKGGKKPDAVSEVTRVEPISATDAAEQGEDNEAGDQEKKSKGRGRDSQSESGEEDNGTLENSEDDERNRRRRRRNRSKGKKNARISDNASAKTSQRANDVTSNINDETSEPRARNKYEAGKYDLV